MNVRKWLRASTLLVVACAIVSPAWGAGFGIFEQGARGMGMAGAFTAQAEDGSAMFHNVAGLAFQHEKSYTLGVTVITISESEFQGTDPFPGSSTTGEQDQLVFTPLHAYYVRPVSEFWTFGFSFNTPFGLSTKWDNPDDWAGRYLSYEANLRTFDFGFNLGGQLTETFGVGIGLVARASDLALHRRVPGFEPASARVVDIANADLESDFDFGFGFNLGVLHKVTNSLSWGFSYRSEVEIDYSGDADFTQIPSGNPVFDAGVASLLPFADKTPIETTITFPAMASLGLALRFTANTVVEIDVNWTEWTSFDTVPLTFTERPDLSSDLPQGWDDAYNYRLGFGWTTSSGAELRLGYVYDESPQPDESVSPLLPDSARNGYTIGWGFAGRRNFDIALMYLPFESRATDVNRDDFNGAYKTTAYLLSGTFSF